MKNILKYFLIATISVFLNQFALCQHQNISFSGKYHFGYMLAEYPFTNYFTNDYIKGGELSFEKKTSGKYLWQQLYNYPTLNLNLYYSNLGNDSIYGKVIALYPGINITAIKRKKAELSINTGLFVCYATKKFDINNNIYAFAVGSHFNFFFNFKTKLKYKITPQLFASCGLSFGHLSNAGLNEPNIGLNFLTSFAGLEYQFYKEITKIINEIPKFYKTNEYLVTISGALKHTRAFEERKYKVFSASVSYKRQFSYKWLLGGGFDYFYDTSIKSAYELKNYTEYSKNHQINAGFHISEDLIFGKITVGLTQGVYLKKDKTKEMPIYDKLCVNYNFTKYTFLHFAIKSHLHIVDFVELGIGFRYK